MAVMIREAILLKTQDLFGVRPHDVTGPSRYGLYLKARYAVCLALRRRGWSYGQIGALLGGRDHTTIMNACENAERMVTADPAYAAKVTTLAEVQAAGGLRLATPAEEIACKPPLQEVSEAGDSAANGREA